MFNDNAIPLFWGAVMALAGMSLATYESITGNSEFKFILGGCMAWLGLVLLLYGMLDEIFNRPK